MKEVLEKYESYFNTAVKAQYIRGLTSKQVAELHTIYQELFKKKLNNLNCNSCVFNMVKDLGIYYFENKDSNEQLKTKNNGKKGKKKRSQG